MPHCELLRTALQVYGCSRALVLCGAAVASLLAFDPQAAAQVQIETVALTGDRAPGTPTDVVFDAFELFKGIGGIGEGPVIGPDGRVAFAASLVGPSVSYSNDNGIWFEDLVGLSLAAREGEAAPGRAGRIFNAFGYLPAWVPGGGLALTGSTLAEPPSAPGSPQPAIWVGTPGDFELAVHQGDTVPDQAANVTFRSGTASDANATGQVAIAASLTGNLDALFVWTPPEPPASQGSLRSVVFEGDAAPGTALAFFRIPTISNPTSYPARLADDGTVAFQATLGAPDYPVGIWREGQGGLELVAIDDTVAPGTGGASYYAGVDEVNRSASGRISYFAFVTGGDVDSGLFAVDGGGAALDVAAGDPVPGNSGDAFQFSQPGPALIRGDGIRSFVAGFDSGGEALFVGAPGTTLRELMRLAAPTPAGGPPGAVYLWGSGSTRRLVVDLDSAGRVAVLTQLAGVSGDEDLGLFLADAQGPPQWVARKGGTLDVAPGDARVVSDLAIAATSETPYRALSESGHLAFRAKFTDGSAGVFVASLPEPDGTVAALGALLVLAARARASRSRRAAFVPSESGCG